MAGQMKKEVFPVKNNYTVVPEKFSCSPLDLSLPEFRELVAVGCTSITPVISSAGWEIARRGNSEPGHIDLFFVISGSISLCTAGETIVAGAGDVLRIISWQDRYVKITDECRYIYVCFDNPEYYPYVRCNSIFSKSKLVAVVDHYIKLMLDRNIAQPEEYRYMQSLASLLTILFMRELKGESAGNVKEVEDLQKILSEQSGKNFEVRYIAREMGMSLSKFRIFCLTHFNKTPRAVVEDFRMTRARGMLDFSMLTIDEIAGELGFTDRFAFSKAFARVHKLSPGAFRKRYARKA